MPKVSPVSGGGRGRSRKRYGRMLEKEEKDELDEDRNSDSSALHTTVPEQDPWEDRQDLPGGYRSSDF